MLTHRSPELATFAATAVTWPGVEVVPHRFGGAEFRMGHAELGHVHADGTLDLQFPRPLRDRLIDEGWANIHHVLPASGWVTFHIASADDLTHALRLLRVAYLRRRLRLRADDAEAVDEVSALDMSPELIVTLLGKIVAPPSMSAH